MGDREKMLIQLEGIGIGLDMAGYHDDAQCVRDALALLREQEPVRFKVTQQCRSYPFWDAECEGCGYKTSTIHKNWKYCPECGRKVKWADADGT